MLVAAVRVGIERVGIIPQRRDCNVPCRQIILDFGNAGSIQLIHVDMRDSRVAAFGFPDRPAHHFDAAVAVLRRKIDHVLKILIRQNSAGKTKFHVSDVLAYCFLNRYCFCIYAVLFSFRARMPRAKNNLGSACFQSIIPYIICQYILHYLHYIFFGLSFFT